jgi:putative transcriptional regulator
MPLTETELLARDASRDIGAELLESIRRIKAGELGRTWLVPTTLAVAARLRIGLSQAEFAAKLGVSRRTLQAWERGRREPPATVRTLLRIVAHRPDVALEVFNET